MAGGVVYRWSMTDNLRVYLVSIEWMPEHLRTLPLSPPLLGRTQGVRFPSQAHGRGSYTYPCRKPDAA